ncbi:MAG: hypothetical protein ACPGES_11320, partial [Coraliomargarita sp.]
MKLISILPLCIFAISAAHAAENLRADSTIILNESGVRNLRIQTEEAEERDFETTVFAIGRV